MIFEYLPPLITIVDITFAGVLMTYFFRLTLLFEARIAAGALIGTVILGYLMLLVSSFVGLNILGLTLVLFFVNTVGILLIRKDNIDAIKDDWQDFKRRIKQLPWLVYFFFIGIFLFIFGYLAFHLLTFQNGRFFVQPVHAYGDISLHLSIISSFAFGDNFPIQSPILSGTKISYPFLVDFITAIFVNPLSLRLDQATALVGILLMFSVVILLAEFSLKITKSKLAACLVLILFFFNGGLGFWHFFEDLQLSNLSFFQFLQILPRDYTALKELGYFWINVVISMFLPQRSFLLGFPLSILILYIFWELSVQFNVRRLILGILLASLLPIIHIHSLIVLSPFLLWLIVSMFLKNKNKIILTIILGFIGILIIFLLSKFFLQQSETPFSLMKYKIGWMAPENEILDFYLKNFGYILFFIPLAIIGGLIKRSKLAYFALIGQLWFVIPSLFILQPWEFDNTKFFIYWYFSSVFVLAFLLSKIILSKNITGIILVGTIMYVLVFAGFLDIVRLISSSGVKYEIYSPQAIKLAEFIKKNSPKDAVFLSIDKSDNPGVSLAGRKTVVGYHGWLWTYGLNYSSREADVRSMLSGAADASLFKKYNVGYVLLFENEENNYIINRNYFSNYQLIYNQDGYKIYKI